MNFGFTTNLQKGGFSYSSRKINPWLFILLIPIIIIVLLIALVACLMIGLLFLGVTVTKRIFNSLKQAYYRKFNKIEIIN